MKWFWSILCVIILIVCIIFGKTALAKKSEVTYPFRQVDAVYDANGNLLQQTLYNEETNEYLIKNFKYALQNNKWICVDQDMSIIHNKITANNVSTNIDNFLNIYDLNTLQNEPIVLLCDKGVRVSVTKWLTADRWYEFGFELFIENTTDAIITVALEDVAIMDRLCDPVYKIDHIDANSSAYFVIAWDKDTLDRCHVPYINNIEFALRVFQNGNWPGTAMAGTHVMLKQSN